MLNIVQLSMKEILGRNGRWQWADCVIVDVCMKYISVEASVFEIWR